MPCNCQRPRWTNEESALVREHYGRMPTKELAALLGRSDKSVMDKASREGLTFCNVRPEDNITAPLPSMSQLESLDCVRLRKWAHDCANTEADLRPHKGVACG